MNAKRAEIGISTLIILITVILLISLIGGIYLFNVHKFESEAYKSTDKTSKYVMTKVSLSELTSTYFDTDYIKDINGILKVETKEGVKLGDLTIHIKTAYSSATLDYHEGSLTQVASGFYTRAIESCNVPCTLSDDWDSDDLDDYIYMNATDAVLNLSSGEQIVLGSCSGATLFVSTMEANDYINSVSGSCVAGNPSELTLTPVYSGRGHYTVEYLKQSAHYLSGMLNSGDIVKVYFEMPEALGTEEIVTITLIPKIGTPTEVMFVTPDAPSVGTAYLSHY